jgi:hypothetical protein
VFYSLHDLEKLLSKRLNVLQHFSFEADMSYSKACSLKSCKIANGTKCNPTVTNSVAVLQTAKCSIGPLLIVYDGSISAFCL